MPLEKTITYKADTKQAEEGIKKLTQAEKKAANARKKQLEDQKKEQQELIDSMGMFGVSVGGLKKNFQALKVASSLTFKSMKAGLIATGIGAFVVAIGSLVSFFTQTKRGAELLETALAGVGAVVSVITDRMSALGELIINGVKLWLSPIKAVGKALKGDFKGALDTVQKSFKDVKDSGEKAFKGIGAEIKNEIKIMTDLSKATIALRDSQRELNVETAKQRAEVEALKLIAEDRTKTEEERLEAAEEAFRIEQELLDQRVANAEEAVRIQKEEMEASENTAEDLDKLAELEIALFNIKQESGTKQIELNNKINAIKQETINKIKQEEQAEKDKIEAVKAAELKAQQDRAKSDETFQKEIIDRNKSAEQQEIDDLKLSYQRKQELLEERKDELVDFFSLQDELNTELAQGILAIENKFKEKRKEEADARAEEVEQEKERQAQSRTRDQENLEFLDLYFADAAHIRETYTQEQINQIVEPERKRREEIAKSAAFEDAKRQANLSAAKSVTDALGGLAKEGTKGAKAMALTGILIDTAKGISGAIAAGAGLVFPANLVAIATGVSSVLAGIANAKKIFAKAGGDSGGIDASASSISSGGGGIRSGDFNAPNVENIGTTQLGEDTPVAPIQAYVVENDISNSQALQEELETQATL